MRYLLFETSDGLCAHVGPSNAHFASITCTSHQLQLQLVPSASN
jgi:hypothetical protein